jgi:WD40 repeat protein/DNA-binding SARP family transcriptional activator
VRFAVLGPVEVSGESGPVPLGGPKQRIVLAHLVLGANQVVSAEHLIDALWGKDLPEDPKATLRVYVSRIRSALGLDAVEARAPGYLLKAERDEVDALRFEELLDQARSNGNEPRAIDRLLGEALALWRGPAFADLTSEPSLAGEIARLEELRLQAIEEKVAAELELGHHVDVVAELEPLTRAHPLRERLWGELMLALYRSDRQGEALAAFSRARNFLSEELGIDPSQDLRVLHQRILRQDPDLDVKGEPLRGYRLIEQIGEGAFGVVYRATQTQIGREVAIKAVPPELANHPDFVRRFEREAQIVARLEHPHIVPLYDYWREPDAAYLVMRFLRGGTLEELLKAGPLEPDRAASILDQVSAALSAAHRLGMVHRDIKPANVLLDEEGNAYLTDFAVALDAGLSETSSRTMMRRTPAYLSPEQLRHDPASPQTDVFALGIVAYEMLTGVHPFPETSPRALLDRHLKDPMRSVREIRPELPAAIDRVIARATATEAEERFSDPLELAAAFRAAGEVTGRVAEPIGEIRNPYKGLRAFLEADAPDFFGRDALTQRLLRRLEDDGDVSRFLAVVGPSGSGKSSVVRAGLVPALRRGALEGSERWYVIDLIPGSHPLRELESSLLALAIEPPSSLLDMLEGDPLGLVRAAERILPDPNADLVIVLDQLEEVFTLVADEDERLHVLECLRAAATAPGSRVRIITTLRADFFDQPLSVRGFGDLLARRTEAITPLSPEELERAIVAPADRAGLTVEPRLVVAMIADVVDRPGALPLLQYALTELAERREDGVLTLAGYRRIGGVSGALARRAEQIFGGMNEEAREACRQLFLRLVTLGEGAEDTRRRVRRSELIQLAEAKVMDGACEAFGRHRLLSFDRDPPTREPTVEIAHEALLTAWDRLRDWIDEAREDIRTQRRLAFSVAEWEAAERDPSFLLTGSRLDQVQAWAERTTLAISDADRAYLRESTAAQRAVQERERALERRSIRRLRSLVAIGVAAALVASTLTIIALNQRHRAEAERRRAEEQALVSRTRELAAAAVANLQVDPERSILLAMAAVDEARTGGGTVLSEAEGALHLAVTASRVVKTVPGLGGALDWSPNGLFVTEGPPGTGMVEIWDAATGERVRSFKGHDGDITDVAFSRDGSKLATTGDDGVLKVWNPSTRHLLASVSGRGAASGPSFSADGSLVAAAWTEETDSTIRVLDLRTGRVVWTHVMTADGADTALSPNGKRLAAVVSSDYVNDAVFDLKTGKRLLLPGKDDADLQLAWSPDGRYIATTAGLGPPRLWDADTGRRLATLSQMGLVSSVAWSPDSSRLVTGGREVKVWKIGRDGHVNEVQSLSAAEISSGAAGVAFSADGTRVMAGAADFTAVKIWDIGLNGNAEWANLPSSPRSYDNDADVLAEFMGDDRLVTTSHHGTELTVWDVRRRQELRTIAPRTIGGIYALDVSPNGREIAVGGGGIPYERYGGDVVGVWDAATGQELFTVFHRLDALDVAFSPDGEYMVSAGWSESAKVVDGEGHVIRVLKEEKGLRIDDVAFSFDGRFIAMAADRGFDPGGERVDIWDWEKHTLVRTIEGASLVEFDPSGPGMVTVLGGRAEITDPESGRQVAVLAAPSSDISALAFSPDGSLVATGHQDGSVRLFDADTGSQHLALPANACAVDDLAFSPDGTKLASTSACDGIRVWALDLEDLLRIARQNVTRSLSDEECLLYLHEEQCPPA